MKNPERIKITVTEKVETHYEVELPCYRMAWCNDEPWAIYKVDGTYEKQNIKVVKLASAVPTYDSDCLPNAFREGNTVSTEMEWLDAIQGVINHLTNEVESACKVLTTKN